MNLIEPSLKLGTAVPLISELSPLLCHIILRVLNNVTCLSAPMNLCAALRCIRSRVCEKPTDSSQKTKLNVLHATRRAFNDRYPSMVELMAVWHCERNTKKYYEKSITISYYIFI